MAEPEVVVVPAPQNQQEQIELAKDLQGLLLADFKSMLLSGTMSPTDRATLTRLLASNGWSLDETQLPQSLKNKLTKAVDPKLLDDDVVGRIA